MDSFVKIGYIFRELRWHQWYKGFFTFFALLWVTHQWQQHISLAFVGAIAFNVASSIVYLINDLRDIDRDRKHPEKKKRPLAAGQLSAWEVYGILVLLCGLLLIMVAVIPSTQFNSLLLVYLLANLAYSYGLKHLPYLDIMLVSAFACFRVVGGFVLLGVPVAWYIVAVVFTLAMFVHSMQRLAEISLGNKFITRPALRFYSPNVLKLLMTIFMIVTVFLYYVATSMIAAPLVYTDVLYFLVLLSMQQYMMSSENEIKVAGTGYSFLVHHRQSLVLVVLLILTIITFGMLYF